MSIYYKPNPQPWYGRCKAPTYPSPRYGNSEISQAFTSGDYSTAINLLTEHISRYRKNFTTTKHDVIKHAFLARAMCYQQERDFSKVLADALEVLKLSIEESSELVVLTSKNQNKKTSDSLFCHVLALWLRSLAFESLEKWELTKKDLIRLKLLIREHNNLANLKDGILSPLLKYMVPLIAQTGQRSIIINLQCVIERLGRIENLLEQDNCRRNDPAQAFRLVNESAKDFQKFVQRFHYRLLLRKPIHPNIHLEMWYTMDIMVVSEMGLFKRADMDGVDGYTLGCKILYIGDKRSNEDENFEVQVRALSAVSCEWSGLTATEWAGVRSGGLGGLEFKITRKNQSMANFIHQEVSEESENLSILYLQVYPVKEMIDKSISNSPENSKLTGDDIPKSLGHHLVPLVIGPIHLTTCQGLKSFCEYHCLSPSQAITPSKLSQDGLSSPQLSQLAPSKLHWDDSLVNSFRAFELPNGKNLLIKELWDFGIPGKVWDSAFIIVQLFKDKLVQDPSALYGKKILDLSTGTGFVGLYLAALISNLPPKNDTYIVSKHEKAAIILTDLEEALGLIQTNHSLNQYLFQNHDKVEIEIKTLRWGELSKAKNIGVIDVVLASDVVYEPELFEVLIETFFALCTPGVTKIFLGYKRRGLTFEEECKFFKSLNSKLKMRILDGLGESANESNVQIYELWRNQ